MQTIKLNLIPGSVLPVVNVSQYDTNRQFALQVYDGAATYDLTGKTVEIRGTKPDGNGFAYDAQDGVVSVSGNTVTISTTQQMTAVGGQTMAELRIKSGTTILGTINFILDVEHSALSDDTPISETEIPVIERDFAEALEEAREAAQTATTQAGIATTKAGEASTSASNASGSATTAAADALKAEGYAVGKQNGSPVGSESPYYHNNAEYHDTHAGEQAYNASQSATAAGNSATAAAADSLEAEGWAVGEQGGNPVGPDSPYYHNNAAYYAQQSGQHAAGGINFQGSLAFADLPTVGMASGDEYNITDDFTTDSRFIEGAGLSVKAGTNIAWVAGNVNKWDILATGGGGADALDDLTDVDLTSPADGDLLQYNATSQKWENSDTIPDELSAMQEAGSVNHFKITAADQVVDGITYIFDAETITANGTSSATTNVNIADNVVLPAGIYSFILDAVSGSGNMTFGIFNRTTGTWLPGMTITESFIGRRKITITSNGTDRLLFQCNVYTGYTATNRIIKCMICDARLVNPPYQPFTMTNRELTDAVEAVGDWEDITSQCTFPQESRAPHETDATMVLVNKSQKLISICARFNTSTVTDFGNQLPFLNLPTGYRFKIPWNGYSNLHFVAQGLAQVRISDAVYTGVMDTHRQLWWRYQNSSDNGVGQMVLSYPTAGTAKAGYLVIPLLVAPIQ